MRITPAQHPRQQRSQFSSESDKRRETAPKSGPFSFNPREKEHSQRHLGRMGREKDVPERWRRCDKFDRNQRALLIHLRRGGEFSLRLYVGGGGFARGLLILAPALLFKNTPSPPPGRAGLCRDALHAHR